MPNYLIAFNDEWVPPQITEQLQTKSQASMAVLEEMKQAGVFVFADGGIDASTALFSVQLRGGEPAFTDGPFVETQEHLGGFTVINVSPTTTHATGRDASPSASTGRRKSTASRVASKTSSTGRLPRASDHLSCRTKGCSRPRVLTAYLHFASIPT